MVDIARSPEVKRKKQIRRMIYGAVALIAIVLITVGVSRLRPAAPSVDRATVWIDTVKRGPMIRQVRGSGILVPENIRWITATTQRPRRTSGAPPGRDGDSDDGHPRAEQPGPAAVGHGCAAGLPVREAAYREPQGGPPEPAAQSGGRRRRRWSRSIARRASTLAANEELYKEKLISELQLKQFRATEQDLKNQLSVARQRLEITQGRHRSRSWHRRKPTSISAGPPTSCACGSWTI